MGAQSSVSGRESASRDVRVDFSFVIVDGEDPSKRSAPQKGVTRTLGLTGMVFEPETMEMDGFHLSFAASGFGRNSLDITLELGKKYGSIEIFGEVEWYEKRVTQSREVFIVGVGFADIQADSMTVFRDYLRQTGLPAVRAK
jgi:hypothetical protein